MRQVQIEEVREGSVVVVRGGFGTEPPAAVRVSEVEEDIKNGRPGICYVDAAGSDRWAYLSQVVSVVSF